jgi:hypothetical protein
LLVNPAGLIVGLLAVTMVIAAEGTRQETISHVVAAAVITMFLWWLADAYAYHEASRLEVPVRWNLHDTLASLASGLAVLVGAAVPIVVVLIAWLAGASLEVAVTAALWAAGAELAGFELYASIHRHLGRRDLVFQTLIGLAMGLGILGIRLLLH